MDTPFVDTPFGPPRLLMIFFTVSFSRFTPSREKTLKESTNAANQGTSAIPHTHTHTRYLSMIQEWPRQTKPK